MPCLLNTVAFGCVLALSLTFLQPQRGPAQASFGDPRSTPASGAGPSFELVQPELFGVAGGQPNCWGDADGDGDLDLFVGFKADLPNRLYRNDEGRFVEVASTLGMADLPDTRAAAWGDFDADGDLDLYVGFTRRANTPNRLYRNGGAGRPFEEVGGPMGVAVAGLETRQVAWIDFDNDGDLDLFVAFRDAPNALFLNQGGVFRNVAPELGVADARKTVGAVWFDYDQDGRLDLFVANQDGDANGLWRNQRTGFVDVAPALGLEGRVEGRLGSNGPSLIDVNRDGLVDLFVAGYGRNLLYRNLFRTLQGRFTEAAAEMGAAGGERATPSAWGDYDNDGQPDLYVSSYIDKPVNERDYLYRLDGGRLRDVTPDLVRKRGATHGVQWADFDQDGDLDLALTNNNPTGSHSLFRNLLAAERRQLSISVSVVDPAGRATRAGSEVRVYAAGTRQLLGTRVVDSGSGYVSQSVMPVHVGLGRAGRVDVEVTSFGPRGRQVTWVRAVDPASLNGRPLIVKVADAGRASTGVQSKG